MLAVYLCHYGVSALYFMMGPSLTLMGVIFFYNGFLLPENWSLVRGEE